MRIVALIVAVVSFPLLAEAADKDARFGSPRTLALSGSISLYNARTGDTNLTVLSLAPTGMFFVTDNFAVGLGLGLGWFKPSDGDSTTTVSFVPTVGLNVPVAPAVSVFPQVGVGYGRNSAGGGGSSFSSTRVALQGFVPVLVHVGNFFLGGGPMLEREIYASYESSGVSRDANETTTFGLMTMLGGWL